MSSARTRRRLVRGGMAAAAFFVASGISAGAGAPPEEPLLRFSTYLGGTGNDEAKAVAVGPDGVVWVAADVMSNDFPGVPSNPLPGGDRDVVVLRIDAATHKVLSTAHLGGLADDHVVSIAVDGAGNAYIAGETTSPDFPLTGRIWNAAPFASQPFVARVLPDGSGFAWAFAFGGTSGQQSVSAMCLTADGDPVVVGRSVTNDFPTASPLQTYAGGYSDAFVTRIGPDGTDVVFSTFLGGSDADEAASVCMSPNGGIVVVGFTTSVDFLTTPDRIVGVPAEPNFQYETFLAELDARGTELRRAAGLGLTYVRAIAAASDSLVLAGYAVDGLPFAPPTPPEEQRNYGFLLRLDASSWTPLGGAFLSEQRSNYLAGLAVGADGTVWTAGGVGISQSLPVPGAVRPHPSDPNDAYVAAFDPKDFTQVFGTYLGGDGTDAALAIAAAPDGHAWVVGATASSAVPFPTVHAVQAANASTDFNDDAFIAELSPGDPAARPAEVAGAVAVPTDDDFVRVGWTAADAVATGFAIDRAELSPTTVGWRRVAVVAGTARDWTDTGVRIDRTCRYSVQAFDDAGGSAASAPAVATIPATLNVSIRQGRATYSWGRPRSERGRGDVFRIRGTIRRVALGSAPLDPAKDGLLLVGGDVDWGNELFGVQPGAAGWRVLRNGVRRWRGGTSRIDFDPESGEFDARIEGGAVQPFTDPDFGVTQFRLQIGRDAGATVPLWRHIRRRGAGGQVIGGRTP